MLSGVEALVSAPEFQTAAQQVIPDPATYADWFSQADDDRRKLAVGASRYSAMQDVLGQEPGWEHFLDHGTGALLSLHAIRNETPARRAERVAKVRTAITARGQATRTVARLGFVPAPTPAAVSRFIDQPHPKALAHAQRMLGNSDPSHLASLAGAPPGAAVSLDAEGRDRLLIRVSGPGYSATRTILKTPDGLVIRNEQIDVAQQKQGMGSEIFARQVEAAAKAGVVRIDAKAARTGNQVGYIVLPKWGFDGLLPAKYRKELPVSLAGAKTIQELYALPGGMDWWKQHGGDIQVSFVT